MSVIFPIFGIEIFHNNQIFSFHKFSIHLKKDIFFIIQGTRDNIYLYNIDYIIMNYRLSIIKSVFVLMLFNMNSTLLDIKSLTLALFLFACLV